jgi:battenin
LDPVMIFPKDTVIVNSDRQYQFYQSLYQAGVFVSRSSVNLFPVKRLYLPASFQLMNAVLLSTVAVYNWVPSIWIIAVIILWEGLLGGAIYVNTFYLMSERFFGAEKEFCLGATSMSYSLSITIAAIIGIWYGPQLKDQSIRLGYRHPSDWLPEKSC